MKQCCTELPLFLFSFRHMVELVHETVLGTELPLFLFSLRHMVELVHETVLYRAPTFSLLLVSHGGISS